MYGRCPLRRTAWLDAGCFRLLLLLLLHGEELLEQLVAVGERRLISRHSMSIRVHRGCNQVNIGHDNRLALPPCAIPTTTKPSPLSEQ